MKAPRYGNQDLWLPKDFHSELVDHSDRLVGNRDSASFPRQVDLWWFAMSVGLNRSLRTTLPARDQLVKFNDGGILESDPWRITHLELISLAEEGQAAAANPARVIQLANEYAIGGCAELLTNLRGVLDTQMHMLAYASSLDRN